MLKGLSSKLRESLEKITKLSIVDKEAIEELVKDIQRSLLSADVDVALVVELSETIKKRALVKLPAGLSRKEHVIKVVYEELTKIMGEKESQISIEPKKILLVGLYGSGKTTTSAKLARFYQKKGLKPVLICCDTVRPAAFDQLEQLSKKIDVPFYGERGENDSSKVLRNGLKKIKADVIIVDSSGRNALEKELINEIKSLNEILKSDEKILVIPADIGQAAKEQATAFHNALNITDVIVTKLDATAKGGGALTACYTTGSNVKFITIGETTEDLQIYNPEKFVARLIGFPDLETLLEKARSVVDEKKATKILEGDFTLDDFYAQFESIGKVGSFSQIMDMMGMGKLTKKVPDMDMQQEKIKRWGFILKSMTPEEKANPDIINSPRVHRIAIGSGCSDHEVRELIGNYKKIKKMMKNISPGKLKRGGMASLFRQMGVK